MKLTFERPSRITDWLRRYAIIVDGEQIAQIRSGQTKVVDVSEEKHQVPLKIDWCGSNSVTVNDDVSEKRFLCYNTFAGWRMLIPLYVPFVPWYYITFGRHRYLTLEEA